MLVYIIIREVAYTMHEENKRKLEKKEKHENDGVQSSLPGRDRGRDIYYRGQSILSGSGRKSNTKILVFTFTAVRQTKH